MEDIKENEGEDIKEQMKSKIHEWIDDFRGLNFTNNKTKGIP